MSEPIRDVEELGDLIWAYTTLMEHIAYWRGGRPLPDWMIGQQCDVRDVISRDRDRICPPGTHVVVPRAEHDALLAAGDLVIHIFDSDGPCSASMVEAVNAFWQRLAEYRAALGTEATE